MALLLLYCDDDCISLWTFYHLRNVNIFAIEYSNECTDKTEIDVPKLI